MTSWHWRIKISGGAVFKVFPKEKCDGLCLEIEDDLPDFAHDSLIRESKKRGIT